MINLTLLVFAMIAHAQSVDPCNGNSTKPYDLSDAMILFNVHGISLSDYDWDNSNINCHINIATQANKKKQTIGLLADIGIGLGLAGVSGGIGLAAGGNGGAAPLAVLGSLITVGSVAVAIVMPRQQKKEMNYHIGQVDAYLKSKKNGSVKQ